MDSVKSLRVEVQHEERLLITVTIDGRILENVVAASYQYSEISGCNRLTLELEADSIVEFIAVP